MDPEHISIVEYFCFNREKYENDWTIKFYLKIFGIDLQSEPDSGKLHQKISNVLYKYPGIRKQINQYILTGYSKIDFLKNFSEEQQAYITNLDTEDTKLIACAGSGKTRSIIGRIKFMVEHGLADSKDIYAITFSKHAATDFHHKIKSLFADYDDFCVLKNFSTIDSLAKSILIRVKTHKSENVEILSIAFRNYLRDMPKTDIELIQSIKKISYLFIDEAQDLNEVQFDIAMLLKKRFGTKIYLIGDPNQNIYQFRRSSSKFLIGFPGKTFQLTQNFRSTQQIIDFADGFKPIETAKTVSATDKQGPPVTVISKNSNEIHKLILEFIRIYETEKDLSNIAIICPTRGIGTYNSVGLSVFFNLFKIHNIPFIQLYDESSSNDERKKSVTREPGHINLLTYHGTKGLEFDVVFVMDFYQHLFNISPTETEHNAYQYLLYVASSRAMNLMYVCTYTNVHGGNLNHWITFLPETKYLSDGYLPIPKMGFRQDDGGIVINGITELITNLTDEQLDLIHDSIEILDMELPVRRIYPDQTSTDRGKDECLFGTFCEELFYLQYFLTRQQTPRRFSLIEQLLDSNFVVVGDDADAKYLKMYLKLNNLTWDTFDSSKHTLPNRLKYLVKKYFRRTTALDTAIVCTSQFIKIIEENMNDIRSTYERYMDPESYDWDYEKILKDFFYLIIVCYAYDNNHYYYICHHGAEKAEILENGKKMYKQIYTFVSNNYYRAKLNIKVNVSYPKLSLMGEIDFIEEYPDLGTDSIVDIKCVKEISMRYYIQLLLYNFCYRLANGQTDKIYNNKYKILNLLTGLEHFVIIRLTPTTMFNILIILAEVGNLTFRDLNLVYDLETNGQIEHKGPLGYKPIIPRSIITKHGTKFYAKSFPEIIEIAIKDYDSGMVLLDTMIRSLEPVKPIITQITGITESMLIGKPSIVVVREILGRKTKRFANFKMMAHNGGRFDDGIILYEKLVDSKCVTFLDTLSIIPIHLPNGMKLESKKLGQIYYTLFKRNFKAHRAMSDVDALMEIMHYLGIQF